MMELKPNSFYITKDDSYLISAASNESGRIFEIHYDKEEGELSRILVTVDRLFADRPALHITTEQDALAHNGNPVPMDGLSEEMQYRLYDSADHFIGICRADTASGLLRLEKMFYDPSGSD